jgi:hypothetical protein
MLPLPPSTLPNSRHILALSLLPTLPLRVLGVALTAKTVVRHVCDTSLQYPVCATSINMRKHFLLPFSCCLYWFQKRFKFPPVRSPRIEWIVADVEFVYSRRLRFATATAILPKHLTESRYDRRRVDQTKDL